MFVFPFSFQKSDFEPKVPIQNAQQLHYCHEHNPMNDPNFRKDIESKVFQPGHSLPTVSLNDFADNEMKMAAQMQEQQAEAERMAKLEEDEDSDKEEVNERKVKKDRAWDDWKDENEKGAGNKMGR